MGFDSIDLWRASIGHFHASQKLYDLDKRKLSIQFFTLFATIMTNIIIQCLNSKYLFGLHILVFVHLILPYQGILGT